MNTTDKKLITVIGLASLGSYFLINYRDKKGVSTNLIGLDSTNAKKFTLGVSALCLTILAFNAIQNKTKLV